MCLPLNFTKFFRTALFKVHLRWLLVNIKICSSCFHYKETIILPYNYIQPVILDIYVWLVLTIFSQTFTKNVEAWSGQVDKLYFFAKKFHHRYLDTGSTVLVVPQRFSENYSEKSWKINSKTFGKKSWFNKVKCYYSQSHQKSIPSKM